MLSIPWCSSLLRRLSPALDRSARLLELLLDRLGLGLRHALLDRLGRPVDQVLGLLEAEPGDLAHHLDDLDLLVARPGEDDREVLLLGCGRRRGAPGRGAGGGHGDRRRCRHAELRLELLHERRGVHEAHVLQEVLHLLARHVHRIALPSGWNRRLYATYEAAFPSPAPLPARLPIASTSRATRAAGSFSVRRSCVAGAWRTPRSCASSTSRAGSVASAFTSATGSTCPSSSAPLSASLGSSSANLTASFATATGSLKPRISVSGPSSIGPSFS